MAPVLLRLLDHLFFLRPLLLVPAATMFLIGREAGERAARIAAGAGSGAPSDGRTGALAAAAALVAALAATHVANQIADRASDGANGKLPYLATGLVNPRAARALFAGSLVLFALLLPLVPARLAPLCLLALALGLVYATPPLLLKARAGWDLAANALGYGGIAFALGWGTAAPLAPGALAAGAAPWVLAVGAVFASTTVVDAPGDSAAGQRTLAVGLGVARTRRLALLLLAAAALTAAATRAPAPLLLAAASLPTMLLPLLRPSVGADHLAFQVGAALPALYAAARAPLFGAALAVAFVAARAYHAARFALRYPALGASALGPAAARPARSGSNRTLEIGDGAQCVGAARRTMFDSSRLSRR